MPVCFSTIVLAAAGDCIPKLRFMPLYTTSDNNGLLAKKVPKSSLVFLDTEIKFLACWYPLLMYAWYCLPVQPVGFSGTSPIELRCAKKSWQCTTCGLSFTRGIHGPNAWSANTKSVL